MEPLINLVVRFGEILANKANTETLIIAAVAFFFAYLYFRERGRNYQLTDLLLHHSELHAGKFVAIATEGIQADSQLASTINQLTTTMEGIRSRLDRIVDHELTPGRRS